MSPIVENCWIREMGLSDESGGKPAKLRAAGAAMRSGKIIGYPG